MTLNMQEHQEKNTCVLSPYNVQWVQFHCLDLNQLTTLQINIEVTHYKLLLLFYSLNVDAHRREPVKSLEATWPAGNVCCLGCWCSHASNSQHTNSDSCWCKQSPLYWPKLIPKYQTNDVVQHVERRRTNSYIVFLVVSFEQKRLYDPKQAIVLWQKYTAWGVVFTCVQ